MALQESGEMYLETIYQLTLEKSKVRSIDIAHRIGYSKPSVSRAVHILEKSGYVTLDDGCVHLTESGKIIAERTFERHRVLTEFFTQLGVSPYIAAEDACRAEHVISDETFNAIRSHTKKFN